MSKVRLTRGFVRRSKCPAGSSKKDYYDCKHTGFFLEVRKSGGKTYYQRYRDRHGDQKQYRIGPAEVLLPRQARQLGKEVLARALIGDNPTLARAKNHVVPFFAKFVAETYLPFAQKTKRSWRTEETLFRHHILPAIGRHRIDEVSQFDIANIIDAKRKAGLSAGTTNRILVLLRFVFNFATKTCHIGLNTNPTRGLTTLPEVYRQRFLTLEEAHRLLEILATDENRIAGNAIKLLLLTGARRNEVTHARWVDINWKNRTLLVPIAKSGRARNIALSAEAIEVFSSIPRVKDNPYVFPSELTGKPPASLHFPWKRIRKLAALEDVRLHDLRHSFASFLIDKGISLYTVQLLLGHTQPRMTQRYAHLASEKLVQAADVVGELMSVSVTLPRAESFAKTQQTVAG